MPLLGAHMSIAGGYYPAAERAAAVGCDVVQLFTKNNNQWKAKPITDDEAAAFGTRLAELRLSHPLSHSSYLLNLASPAEPLRQKSVESCVIELQRAETLGIPYVVIHPGAHMGAGDEAGIEQVAASLDAVLAQTRKLRCQILLETTAGQGSSLGHRFEHLAGILSAARSRDRIGVCLDTCHVFAAGYPLSTPREYRATWRQFDELVGCNRLRAIHLNDSKRELGSRVDRHQHIGRGQVGLEAFSHLLNDRRLREIPMYLETPKGTEAGEDLDAINLRTLRALIKRRA
jgi:deoxyribonuclease-4